MSCMRMPRIERDTHENIRHHVKPEVSTFIEEPRNVADWVSATGEPPSPDQRHNNIEPHQAHEIIPWEELQRSVEPRLNIDIHVEANL